MAVMLIAALFEFHGKLIESFPKLEFCGGFELMRCIPQTRQLELIKSPVCHSPRLLRSYMGAAKVYIRPIQENIDIEMMEPRNDVNVSEVCFDNLCHNYVYSPACTCS